MKMGLCRDLKAYVDEIEVPFYQKQSVTHTDTAIENTSIHPQKVLNMSSTLHSTQLS